MSQKSGVKDCWKNLPHQKFNEKQHAKLYIWVLCISAILALPQWQGNNMKSFCFTYLSFCFFLQMCSCYYYSTTLCQSRWSFSGHTTPPFLPFFQSLHPKFPRRTPISSTQNRAPFCMTSKSLKNNNNNKKKKTGIRPTLSHWELQIKPLHQ